MEPDPTALSAPLNDDTDDDELYERTTEETRREGEGDVRVFSPFLSCCSWRQPYRRCSIGWRPIKKATPDKFLLPVSLIFAGISIPISIHMASANT